MGDNVLTKADIVDAVHGKMGLPRQTVAKLVDDLFGIIRETLGQGEDVKIPGLGNFEVRDKKARLGRNPQSGERLTISARRVVSFKPSGVLRKALRNKP